MELLKDLGMIKNKSGNSYRYGLYKCPQCSASVKTTVQNHKKRKTEICAQCILKNRNTTHGLSKEKFYQTWDNMMGRCYNKSTAQFKDWGGRGIVVCDEWKNPAVFKLWFDENYIKGYQIDRIDNDGNYEPNNCRYVSASVNIQNQGKRSGTTSRYKFIDWHEASGKWRVRHKGEYMGLFKTEEEAYQHLHGKIVKGK